MTKTASATAVRYEWLDGDEACDKLNPLLEARGWTPLNSGTSRALIALDEDNVLLGYFVLQLFPFLGPMTSDSPEVMFGLTSEMRKFMTEIEARGYLVICDSPATEQLCKREGMALVQSPVYLKGGL